MAFSVADFDDFVDLLNQHPEWRPRLVQALLSEEFLALPAEVRENSRAIRDLIRAQDRTDRQIAELTEGQRQTTANLSTLTQRVDDLTVRLDVLTQRVDELTAEVRGLALTVTSLTVTVGELVNRTGSMDGRLYEMEFNQKAPAILGSKMRRIRVVPFDQLESRMEDELSDDEHTELVRLDAIVRGVPKSDRSVGQIWLGFEVSAVVDRSDVERAIERAGILRRVGLPTLPAVSGQRLTEGAADLTRDRAVVVVQNGLISNWDEALGQLPPAEAETEAK